MIFVNKRYLCYFDWISLFLVLMLSSISLCFVFSTTCKAGAFSLFFKKQIFGILSGVLIYFFCSFIDYRTICRTGYWLYLFTIGLLIFTLIKGSVGMGAQRWINLGFVKFQSSELAKLFFPMFITYYFLHDTEQTEPKPITYGIPLAVICLSFILVLKQPDLGTGLVILFSGSLMLWFTGLQTKFFMMAGLCVLVTAPISWHFLKPYQKKRILVFFGEGDRNKERYQIEQSKIAVGSGGILGKGIGQGTQNKMCFLPESRTDFIFSVICEETGFVGAMIVITTVYFALFSITWTHFNHHFILSQTHVLWTFSAHCFFNHDQYWHGARFNAHCRNSSALYELWNYTHLDWICKPWLHQQCYVSKICSGYVVTLPQCQTKSLQKTFIISKC